jgi:SAM-dependent methyltransferase
VATQTINEEKLEGFMNQLVGELGATVGAALVVTGDRLGLWKAMAGTGGVTPRELAERTGTSERYIREWLCAQAAGGFVEYDPATRAFSLPPEHALALADESSPFFVCGAFQSFASLVRDEPLIREAFVSGRGVGWHEHSHDLFEGTERFFRTGYAANLVDAWLPALDGVVAKLSRGAAVADVGCGLGASTILMAQAFPESTFAGYDYHEASIAAARERAEEAGLSDRVRFDVASGQTFPGDGYDLIAMFDCLHDMGDPVGAARRVRSALAPDGTWLIVEPFANDDVEDNLNPVGRVYYGASTLVCTPASLSQEVGLGLGAQAGEKRLRDVVTAGGFSRFRRAAETPFNLVLEARP